jgi:hypothetical protein
VLLAYCVANEEMLGFYSSGPKIKENDLKVRTATCSGNTFCV